MQFFAAWAEQRHRAIRKVFKNWDHQRDAIVENSRAALQKGLGITGQSGQKTCAWGSVSRLRDCVVIKAQSDADGEPGKHRPLIAGKPRRLVLSDIEGGWLR